MTIQAFDTPLTIWLCSPEALLNNAVLKDSFATYAEEAEAKG